MYMRIPATAVLVVLLTCTGAAALAVGDKAPGFTASSHVGEVKRSDYLGEHNVIITFCLAICTPA